jgi:hypothetical protein
VKSRIYKFIKDQHEASSSEISQKLGISIRDVLIILNEEVTRGFITVVNGKYHVVHFLMPPVEKPAQGIAWDYGKITEDPTVPSSYMNSLNGKVAPRQQGDRGTCVGQSSAEMMDYNHIKLTGEMPTGEIKRNITDLSPAVRDQLYDQSFSAESIYVWSRKEGNVTYPSGSYCRVAIAALVKKGVCLESQWYTSKCSLGAWATPYPLSEEGCLEEAAKHKLEGYAVITTIAALKKSISSNGVALGAINIYSNYLDMPLVEEDGQLVRDGNLPEISGDLAGSHALCFIGYDDSVQRLYFRHSWEGWTKIGSISYQYWEQAGGDFWAPLDTADTVIGRTLYATLTFMVTPSDACLLINGVQQTGPFPIKVVLERGKTAAIIVSANGYKTQVISMNVVDDREVQLTLEAETTPVVVVPWWKKIIDWIVSLIKR